MKIPNKRYIKHFMIEHKDEFKNEIGEINMTSLAEFVSNELDIVSPTNNFEIPEWIFDMAYDVASKYDDN